MKNIIERNLALDRMYVIIDKKYIPLEHSTAFCNNCGKPIANIATVKDDQGNVFNVGFDCMETLLMNNQLLSQADIDDYLRIKPMIPKIIRFAKQVRAQSNVTNVTGLRFEEQLGGDYFPFFWLFDNATKSRCNDFIKLKGVDYKFLILTLRNIFPTFLIIDETEEKREN